jgi:peptide deformylase
MSIRQIIFANNPKIRQKSRTVRNFDAPLRNLIQDMIETMQEANGIGLAAIQVGVPEQVIVVEEPQFLEEGEEPNPPVYHVVVNPEIARASRETEEGIEGCLSVPGWVGEVERHTAVTVKGLDPSGKEVRIKARGLLARIFQHEIDHCDGVLFIDHIEDSDKIWPVAEGEEEAAEAAQRIPDEKKSTEL